MTVKFGDRKYAPRKYKEVEAAEALHPDTANFRDRLLAKDGATISESTLAATDEFVRGLEEDEVWAKLKLVWLQCGNFAGLPTALKHPSGDVVLFNFVSGNFSEATGLDPGESNASKYVALGAASTIAPTNDFAMGFYCHSNTFGSFREMGVSSGNLQLLASFNNTVYWDCYDFIGGRAAGFTSDSSGLFIGSRTSSTDSRIYRNGAQIAAISTDGGPANTEFLDLFRAAGAYSSRRLSMCFVSQGLSGAEVLAINNRYSNFAASIGRLL